jgi:hypothetical protein
MPEPVTEAGRALVSMFPLYVERICAIEAEARRAALSELRAALDIIDSINDCHGCFDQSGSEEEKATVERLREYVEP